MTKSDSLDNITLDSDDIKTIKRFENNYYNHKKNILQYGGSDNKLEKNIVRLFTCYLLSQNQIGGGKKSNLTNIIKTRLDNKIIELIVHNNYFNVLNDLEGGGWFRSQKPSDVTSNEESSVAKDIKNNSDVTSNEESSVAKDNKNNSDVSSNEENKDSNVLSKEVSEGIIDLAEKHIKTLVISKIQKILSYTNKIISAKLSSYINKMKIKDQIVQLVQDKISNLTQGITNRANNAYNNVTGLFRWKKVDTNKDDTNKDDTNKDDTNNTKQVNTNNTKQVVNDDNDDDDYTSILKHL